MKRIYYTLRIGCMDYNWFIGDYKTLNEAKKEAKQFSSRGFWIDIRKCTDNNTTTEKLITSTWNS